MDALTGLLDGPRAREAFLLRCAMRAPWALEVRDQAPLTLLTAVRGAVLLAAGGAEHPLACGDVALVRGPQPYGVSSQPGPGAPPTPVQAVVLPGQRCAAPGGGEQHVMGAVGVRAWGSARDAPPDDELLVGTYTRARAVSEELLAALPAVVVLPADGWRCPYLPLLVEEVAREAPGQQAVLDRLLDLVLVAALRAWGERTLQRRDGPGWWSGDDPLVSTALRLLHEPPQRPWTLAVLAAAAGTSRATLARRFTAAVGEPPMAHLSRWRLALAADLLRESDATLEAIARRVGYGSGFALSTAFTRERGCTPSEHRRSAPGDPAAAPAEGSASVASSAAWPV